MNRKTRAWIVTVAVVLAGLVAVVATRPEAVGAGPSGTTQPTEPGAPLVFGTPEVITPEQQAAARARMKEIGRELDELFSAFHEPSPTAPTSLPPISPELAQLYAAPPAPMPQPAGNMEWSKPTIQEQLIQVQIEAGRIANMREARALGGAGGARGAYPASRARYQICERNIPGTPCIALVIDQWTGTVYGIQYHVSRDPRKRALRWVTLLEGPPGQ